MTKITKKEIEKNMKERKTNKKKNQENPTEPIKAAELEMLSSSFTKAADICQRMITAHRTGLNGLIDMENTFQNCASAFGIKDNNLLIEKLSEVAKETPELLLKMESIAKAFSAESELFNKLSVTLSTITMDKEVDRHLPENKKSDELRGYV